VRHWFASPRSAIGFLLHAATLNGAGLGDRRCLTMPGVSATVADEIEALRRFAGEGAVRRIHHQPDETIARIVAGWPREFETRRARDLGFSAEADFDEIIRVHAEDELGR
jgi:D-erythronate 2-dehydrogenase